MKKNFIQRVTSAIVALSVVLSGLSFAPLFAQADNGLHLGANIHAKSDNKNHNVNGSLGINGNVFGPAVKEAKTTFHQSVKAANSTYKNTKKTAHTTFVAAVHDANDQAGRIAALRAYLTNLMAALHTRSASIEAAFQAFINTNFNQNQAPTANAQSVTLQQNTSANITLTGSDPEHSPLTYILVSSTTHGVLSGTTPNLLYTPGTNFTGTDSFTFKVNDGSLNSTLATVLITVNP